MATKREAIMQVACMFAGRDISDEYGPTTADAIDALVDAMAGRDIDSPAIIADAVAGLGREAEPIADSIRELTASLQAAGMDIGSGSLAEALSAAAEYAAGGGGNPPEIVFATDEEVREAFRTA